VGRVNVDIGWRLEGERLPAISLPSTSGRRVALDRLRGRWTVLYTYPKNMVDMPGVVRPQNWDQIPGALG
jgi:hypothetical protein